MSQENPPSGVSERTSFRPADLYPQVDRAIQLVFNLDVVSCEEDGKVEALLEETLRVMREVLATLGPLSNGEIECHEGAPALPADPDAPLFSDLVFMGYLSVLARLGSLENGVPSGNPWDILDLCTGARREALRSLCAIGNSLATIGQNTSYDAFLYDEAMQGVATRRAYVRFREDILRAEPTQEATCAKSLRLCATAIAKLRGRPCYPFMRTQDRLLVHEAQQRVRAFLVDRSASNDLLGARRIWQDIANQCEIMFAINNRPELREHDRRVLAKATRLLGSLDDNADLSAARTLLDALLGRNEELDALVASASTPRATLLESVERCLRRVDSSSADASQISTWMPPTEASPASNRRWVG